MHQRPRRRVYFEPFRNNPENNGVDQIVTRPPIDRAAVNQFLLLTRSASAVRCTQAYQLTDQYLTVTNKR